MTSFAIRHARGASAAVDITEAFGFERKMLKKNLKSGMLYILDRGFIDYTLDDVGMTSR